MRAHVLLLLAVGCSGDPGVQGTDLPEVCNGAPVTTWDNFGAGFVIENCQSCHGSMVVDRQGAPVDVTFDAEDQVWAVAEQILANTTGDEPTMPPSGGVDDDDRYRVEVWLECARGHHPTTTPSL